MENQKQEALRLAEWCEENSPSIYRQSAETAKELRRQHARIQELEAMLDAVDAGGVSAQRITQAKDHIEQDLKMVAAPAVLPEPGINTASHAGFRVIGYTEQQVRELLDKATCTKSQTTAQEPFGYFKAEPFGWRDCAETGEGAVALYEAPQPQADALDTERLNWLIEQGCSNGVVYENVFGDFWMVWLDGDDVSKDKRQADRYPTARDAIDAAIAAAKEHK